ncbi:uncharacterized protein RJT20DRAFT_7905 [Scheffersomyces xylosifermentans]|uniref:uncharacterized protein n=1 Tax=Scheffersomyces xylosifermentans TaxID=1304137 RepID=UPI00315D09A2
METPEYVINISSDEEDVDDNDLEIVEFRKQTQNLIDNPQQTPQNHTTKKLSDVQCPICFDDVTNAAATTCGHIFCLECIQQSISSSHARGQVRGKRGAGLCPLCRKKVNFKDTLVLRMKVSTKVGLPDLPSVPGIDESLTVNKIEIGEDKKRKDEGAEPVDNSKTKKAKI